MKLKVINTLCYKDIKKKEEIPNIFLIKNGLSIEKEKHRELSRKKNLKKISKNRIHIKL